MIRTAVMMAAAVVAASTLEAQAPAPRLQGAWRLVAVRVGDSVNKAPEPSLYLFTARHYSLTRVDAPRSVPRNPTSKATAEELRDLLAFSAQAGTYETANGTLTFRRVAALAPVNMAKGNWVRLKLTAKGDTIVITAIANQDGPITDAPTYTLRRVE
jgi:hypothetical protein